jgi:hypothetical protein
VPEDRRQVGGALGGIPGVPRPHRRDHGRGSAGRLGGDPPLLQALDEGYDLVSGWKQNRRDPISKTIPSKFFNAVTSMVSGVSLHDMNCGLKAYRREVVRSVKLRGELHRFIPVLAHNAGFSVTEIRTVHHPRLHGMSKFGMSRFLNGFLDLMAVQFMATSSTRPLTSLAGPASRSRSSAAS